jgi:hypothetical protein
MENLVGGQIDLKLPFGSGEHVSEPQISHTVEEGAEIDDIASRGGLLLQDAGVDRGGEPGGHHRRIEAKVFGTAALQQRGEGEFGFATLRRWRGG